MELKGNNKGKGSLCGPGTLMCSALSVCPCIHLVVISFTLLDHVSTPEISDPASDARSFQKIPILNN